MEITTRSLVTLFHGLILGGFLLMALYGLGLQVWKLASVNEVESSTKKMLRFERNYLILVAIVSWLVVFSGAYIIYPWYRAIPSEGATDLTLYPQRFLLSNPKTIGWHDLGMEWKEHVAWMAAVSMTLIAYLSIKYRTVMKEHPQIRNAIIVFTATAFLSAAIAGFFGVMLNKNAPVQGGSAIQLMRDSK